MALLPLYNERKNLIEQITIEINSVQSSLDDMIFSIYNTPKSMADKIKQNIQIDL